jgi:hypothetical protein
MGLVALAVVLGALGCSGGDSAEPAERASSNPAPETSAAATTKPVVTKEYVEDRVEGGEEYLYWDLTFDFGDRTYLARVYTDEPEVAYVDLMHVDGVEADDLGAIQSHDPVERANLRTIRRHLSRDGWPKVVIHILGEEGYEPLPLP